MEMKYIKSLIIVIVLAFSFKTAEATNLRGRLIHYDAYSRMYYPMQNTRVDIWIFNGSQWIDYAYVFTGNDGMYYFNNYTPGVYFKIQVNGYFYPQQPLYLSDVPLLDIPQLTL